MKYLAYFICLWRGHVWKDAGTDLFGYIQKCSRCGDGQHLRFRR
jgi:hypothetical protein